MNENCRCIDCKYCDITKAICTVNDNEYNLEDDDLWVYDDCEFFVDKEKQK